VSADVASVWTRLLENCWLLSVFVSFVFCSCIGGFEVLSDDLSAVVFTYEKVGNFCGCVRIHSVRVSLVVGGRVSWCLLRICSSHFFLFFECLPVFWEVFPPPFCVDRFLEFSSCFYALISVWTMFPQVRDFFPVSWSSTELLLTINPVDLLGLMS